MTDLEALDIKERLQKMEKQTRRIKVVGFVGSIVLVAALLIGQAFPKSRTVEAEKFILRDADGKVRAELGMKNDLLGFVMLDKNDVCRVSIGLEPTTGSAIMGFHDKNGQPCILLGASAGGSRMLLFKDNDGKKRAFLGLASNGMPMMVLLDEKEKIIFEIPVALPKK